jgi:hypothetical protein
MVYSHFQPAADRPFLIKVAFPFSAVCFMVAGPCFRSCKKQFMGWGVILLYDIPEKGAEIHWGNSPMKIKKSCISVFLGHPNIFFQ